jgi:(4S)-4-hydroxy-5-phosphonooxypentane-2,3-dione isomerase
VYSLGITVHIKPEHIKEFIEISREVLVMSRIEPGCLWFDLVHSEKEKGMFLFYQAYENEADFQAHLSQTYVRKWLEKTQPLMRGERGVEYPSHYMVYPDIEV